MPKWFPAPFLSVCLTVLAAPDLAAGESALEKLRARLKSTEQYGTECCQLLSIPAAAFVPANPDISYNSYSFDLGYVFVTFESAEGRIWAPVTLPTGAVLDFIDFYYSDLEPNADICAALHAYTGPTLGGNPPDDETLGFVCSSGVESGYAIEEMSGTIDNSVWFSNGAQYAVVITSLAGASHFFKGVTIWWHREVRPAPGSATFNDVPVNHPQFQFIEALAQSGITVGCGGGNYCPDNPLTRGQMAVFLAKALGLYWPF